MMEEDGRSLPPEIIIEIFSRLPVKHLLRFRSVSKHFCDLIDSHHFMKKHLKYTTDNNTTNPDLKLIVKSSGDADFAVYFIDYFETNYDNNYIELYPMVLELYPPVLEDSDDYYGILGSCNGLLCLATCEENYIFWNPNTRKQWDLPLQPVIPSQDYVFMYSYAYGFGHVSESDDYKMVILRICNDINGGYLFTEVDVYSLASNSWRRVESFPDEIFTCPMQNDNVLVNECFHWAAKIGTNDIYDKILSFDIGSESFQMVPSPEVEITGREMNILALGGWLCAFYEFADVRFDLWVMKEYGVKESWTKLFTIGYSEVCDIPMHFVLKPINYFKDCDKLLFTLFLDGKDSILSYDLVRKTVEEVVIDGMPYQFRVMPFLESLVNPKGRSLPLLPPEIIIEIFSRLPVKHLLCFRSVSKHFCALIDSHHFMKKHLKYSTDNTNFNLKLIVKSSSDAEFAVYFVDYFEMNCDNYIELYPMVVGLYPPVIENPDDYYGILGSCNGLLCLITCERSYIFWNPNTRKQWDLPPQPVIPSKDHVFMSSYTYGFGHASESDDYKMLILRECYDCNGGYLFPKVDVYSLASNSWRRVESYPDEVFTCQMQNDNVLVNECLHWASKIGTDDIYDRILSFEIGSESFQMVPSPQVEITGHEMKILALGGWLCAFYKFTDVRFDLWVMKEYGVKESWTKLFTIGYSDVCDVPMHFVLKPINYFRNCDKLLLTLCLDGKDSILSHDLVRETVEEVVIDGMPYQYTVMAFSESLVNPTGGGFSDAGNQPTQARISKKKEKKKLRKKKGKKGHHRK